MRDMVKDVLGGAVAGLVPRYRYENCLFVMAHMRCGSTALSNVLCSRPDISGYGEAHIRYDGTGAVGRLVVNQTRRGAWTPRARILFDKILHSRHDAEPTPAFHDARAIFLVREPAASIASIRALYDGLGRDEYGTDVAAADYYIERVRALTLHWDRFAPDRRVGLTHATLLADPDTALARIGTRLRIEPPLRNSYRSPKASTAGGGGDPTASTHYSRIEPRTGPTPSPRALDIPARLIRDAQDAHDGWST